MNRREKIVSADDAAALIKDGSTVIIGGFTLQNKPMIMVRSMIKRRLKDIFLVTAGPGGIEADMLIGAGCVRKLASSSISAERLAPIGRNYRRCVAAGKLEIWETDQGILCHALKASAMGLPFLPSRIGLGTDYLKVNPDLKLFKDPIKGETLVAIGAINPDIAIIHVRRADPFGNGQHAGLLFFDQLAADAADKIILVAEEIVTNESIKADPSKTTIPCNNVVAVVEAPYGAHPCACHGAYPFDEDMIVEYVRSTYNEGDFQSYLNKYVHEVEDHERYLEMVGLRRILGLKKHSGKGA